MSESWAATAAAVRTASGLAEPDHDVMVARIRQVLTRLTDDVNCYTWPEGL